MGKQVATHALNGGIGACNVQRTIRDTIFKPSCVEPSRSMTHPTTHPWPPARFTTSYSKPHNPLLKCVRGKCGMTHPMTHPCPPSASSPPQPGPRRSCSQSRGRPCSQATSSAPELRALGWHRRAELSQAQLLPAVPRQAVCLKLFEHSRVACRRSVPGTSARRAGQRLQEATQQGY